VKQSLVDKLQQLVARSEEMGGLLSDPDIIGDQNRFRELSREYSQLETIVGLTRDYEQAQADLAGAAEMLKDDDAEIRELGQEEIDQVNARLEQLELDVKKELIPKDPNDDANIYLEIRAGTGGDEAAIFAGDLFKMYLKYAESQRWQVEIVSQSEGEHGGFKEIISRIIGRGAYSQLKFESGAHRVQRVPETEAQGRIHTSACTVAVLPEAAEIDDCEERVRAALASAAEHLLSQDEYSGRNVIIEIRAGTGGDEAALFAADLFRMYSRYAEAQSWKIDTMSVSETDGGCF